MRQAPHPMSDVLPRWTRLNGMRSIRLTLSLALPTLVASSVLADSPPLVSLGAELKLLRGLPVDARTHAKCPDELSRLNGLKQQDLSKALGDPDYIDKLERSWSYSFVSPRSKRMRGGGFPELTFYFGVDTSVIRATCYYSR
jgi:hypothetical protein